MITEIQTLAMYEMSLNVRVTWQAHSLSTIGSNGSNRVHPRRQLLADGTETDATSGNIAKHHHAALVTEYFEAAGCPLCPACKVRDSRRAGALLNHPGYQPLTLARILGDCALCDTHGFLVTAKNGNEESGEEDREGLNKSTLIDFTYALALPDRHAETVQLHARSGASKEEGQMLMKMPVRSGEYALCVRYTSVGIGADTKRWELLVTDQAQRLKRHTAILRALRDALVSPDGAKTATMLPHLTGLVGAIVISTAGRAPIYSALDPTFLTRLTAMADDSCTVDTFDTVDTFYQLMNALMRRSVPALHPSWQVAEKQEEEKPR